MELLFEWDHHKEIANQLKHKISFETAKLVFNDPNALSIQDRVENSEYRWQTLGMVEGCLIVLVAHTVTAMHKGEIIRIISARRANSKERKNYEQNYLFHIRF